MELEDLLQFIDVQDEQLKNTISEHAKGDKIVLTSTVKPTEELVELCQVEERGGIDAK